ncbi:unnamed protein product [Leuciscus chuanchicus]
MLLEASDIQPCHPPESPGNRQSNVLDILQPEADNDLPRQRREPLDDNKSGRLTPSLSHQELTSIIFSLAMLPQASYRRMTNGCQRQHPPPHHSHMCQSEAPQGQLDTPDSELQELLTHANQLPEQDSPEESCKVQASDPLPTPA